MMFKKAVKENAKLRMALIAPSGAGKTYSALRIGSGLAAKEGGRVAFIDTEFKTASKYADRFDFDVLDLTNETPIQTFIDAINLAGKDYSVVIIDSMSHAWESMLDKIDEVAKARYNGNTFAAWKDKAGGKLQTEFTNCILKNPAHVICCFRQTTDWVIETNDKGHMQPKRVGTKIKQKEGIEYEFDMVLEGNLEHYFTVTKDRTGKYQDAIFEKPSEDFGNALYEWLNSGVKPAPSKPIESNPSLEYLDTVAKMKERLAPYNVFPEVLRMAGLPVDDSYLKLTDELAQNKLIDTGRKIYKNERDKVIAEMREIARKDKEKASYVKDALGSAKIEEQPDLWLIDILDFLKKN